MSGKQQKATPKKAAMIEALKSCLGIVSDAANKVGIDRTTHYRWLKEDPEYKTEVENISESVVDFAESKLHSLINQENPTAIIFFLKTKGKKRGYIEKTETETTHKIDGDVFKIGGKEIKF